MGYIYVKAMFINGSDYEEYLAGKRGSGDIRSIEAEALIDTGAAFPALPEDMVEKLGVPITGEGEAETAEGVVRVRLAS